MYFDASHCVHLTFSDCTMIVVEETVMLLMWLFVFSFGVKVFTTVDNGIILQKCYQIRKKNTKKSWTKFDNLIFDVNAIKIDDFHQQIPMRIGISFISLGVCYEGFGFSAIQIVYFIIVQHKIYMSTSSNSIMLWNICTYNLLIGQLVYLCDGCGGNVSNYNLVIWLVILFKDA